MVWRFWPEAKLFTDVASHNVVADYEMAIRDGRNLLPGGDINYYIAEEACNPENGPLLNPEQDVSNTEIDENYQPGRE